MANLYGYRPARPEDCPIVPQLMVQALDDLARKYVNSKNLSDAIPVLEYFFVRKNNLYSFENTLVCEDQDGIAGSITGYDGAGYGELRKPFFEYLKLNHEFTMHIEDETSEGEFYLDTVSVLPSRHGQGIGTGLMNTGIDRARRLGHSKVGLLVHVGNPKARYLYERLGFQTAGQKTILGNLYDHMALLV